MGFLNKPGSCAPLWAPPPALLGIPVPVLGLRLKDMKRPCWREDLSSFLPVWSWAPNATELAARNNSTCHWQDWTPLPSLYPALNLQVSAPFEFFWECATPSA